MKNKNLKLYVWEDVLWDWKAGIMFALAESVEQAREILLRRYPDSFSVSEDITKEPTIYNSPTGFAQWGSQ